ncbi:MAG: hypothetical protein IKQ00_01320 [Butyrivibrio sp.]|nr:hypothetical protein [Butyrivibrio sp.]
MSKYNELMQNIVVTEDMKSRILRNIELELDGRDVLGGDDRKRSREDEDESNGGGSNDIEKVISIDEAGNEKKIRNFGDSLRGRWATYVAAALVFILSGIVVKSIIGDPSHSSSTAVMSEDSYKPKPAPAVTEEAASEEPVDAAEAIEGDASSDSAVKAAGEAEVKDDAAIQSGARFEYEEKVTLVKEYSADKKLSVFHIAQVKNASEKDAELSCYTECYQGNEKLQQIYSGENMTGKTMGINETYGIIIGYSLKNDTDDVSFVVIDRNSPDKKVLFEKTYTMDELKGNSSVLPSDYIEEEQLGGLFDEGVKTK